MTKRIVVVALVLAMSSLVWASSSVEKVEKAATVLKEIMDAPDKGIPSEVLHSARCIAVVPGMIKGGFVFGAAYGRGIASCRTAKGWSAPAFFSVKGGSFGLQIGAQGVDLVMLIMNDAGMERLLSSRFQLGADASVAAGPVGRHAQAGTDWKLNTEILTYSRARGLFAGVTLNGADVGQDQDATRELYGRMVTFKSLLHGAVAPPKTAAPWMEALHKYAGVAAAPAAK